MKTKIDTAGMMCQRPWSPDRNTFNSSKCDSELPWSVHSFAHPSRDLFPPPVIFPHKNMGFPYRQGCPEEYSSVMLASGNKI